MIVLPKRDKPFQLVKNWDELPDKQKTFPRFCEVKYDGVFCAVVVHSGSYYKLSRTGKSFYDESLALTEQVPSEDGVYIGELCNDHCSLEVLSGLVSPNRVNKWTDAERSLMSKNYIVLHDVLTLDELHAGVSTLAQSVRRWHLKQYLVEYSEGKMVGTEEELQVYAEEVIARGHEGIVIKDPTAGYVAGHKGYRAAKIVRGLHVDLKCVDVAYGKGKRTNQIAKLKFMYKGKPFWADLGKGWTDERRDALTAKCEEYLQAVVGKVFHIKALQESSKGVLRLPKVQELRVDKTEEDIT